ncbi:shikimate kinase [Mycoplasmatota bacterium WC30]
MYGLVGKKLSHSFSKDIHHILGNKNYQLFEVDSIENFIKTNTFKGINVTIPYKTEIIPFLDELDDIAKITNSVNTIVNVSGKLIGYNTDYYGLKKSLSYHNIIIKNKKVLILGNGSVSKTVVKLLNDLSASSIVKLCRNIKNKNEFLFQDFSNYLDFDILINTTPVGMYPNNDDPLLFELSKFKKLEVVVDLVYNPLRTNLMLEADKLNIKNINGLYMLVMQAKKAHELFLHKSIPLNNANKIYSKIYSQYLNLVFVGLPLSGKTKYATIIGNLINKKTNDIDKLIEDKYQSSIPDIFISKGEKVFRSYESNIVETIYREHGMAISTGGGLIENSDNMNLLKQNGLVIFLNKNPELIARKKIYGRPLLKNASDILILAKKRVPMYREHSDIIIDLNKDTQYHINEIKEKVDEYISR